MNSEEPASRLVFYCEGLPGLPGGLKKALRGPLAIPGWVCCLFVSECPSASDMKPGTGKGEDLPSRFLDQNF